ncbi:MAG: hypothetical protein HQL50_01365 [Magnetococcales bacterium]|nr:hypothetical protein [Magnetococcales bacterium]
MFAMFSPHRSLRSAATAIVALFAIVAPAQALDLADRPLYLQTRVDPNVFFEVDDSGSMDWTILTTPYWYYSSYWNSGDTTYVSNGLWRAYDGSSRRSYTYWKDMADNAYDSSSYPAWDGDNDPIDRDWRGRASAMNVLYYNPQVTYEPWPGFPDANFYAARSDPEPSSSGYTRTVDLTGFIYELVTDDAGFTGDNPAGPTSYSSGANDLVDLWDTHIRFTVNAASVTQDSYDYTAQTVGACSGVDCITPTITSVTNTDASTTNDVDTIGRTVAEVQQNVANWFQYHRRRSFATKAAIASVITTYPDYRYGLSVINNPGTLFKEMPAEGVEDFTTHNDELLEELYEYNWPASGTPLREGLQNVGEYYEGDLTDRDSPITATCQQNFAVLFTDGYWNGDTPSLNPDDQDGDGADNTLADVAYRYYINDLRDDLADEVPTSAFDGASHQHMVTFGVAFGVTGLLSDTDSDGWPDDASTDVTGDGFPDTDGDWGDPNSSCSDCGKKIDDLWHASFNGRGTFVSARTPQAVKNALSDALADIADRTSSSSSAALNSGSLSDLSRLYQARFDSGDWSGNVVAFPISTVTGELDEDNPAWEARDVLNGQDWNTGRVMYTYNTEVGQGIAFRWPEDPSDPGGSELTTTQMALLEDDPDTAVVDDDNKGDERLEWIRGNRDDEGVASGKFRPRTYVLGDLIHSAPTYVSPPSLDYPESLESSSYAEYKESYASRDAVIYVGGNDGMMHGFKAEDGTEVMAYLPNETFPILNDLTSNSYGHAYSVDGQVTAADVYGTYPGCTDGSSCWRTILVGGLGSGGQGIYALDVTDPTDYVESNANEIALWEFTDSDDCVGVCGTDADRYKMGYTFSGISIVKAANGDWVAIFGNGYNSTDNDGATALEDDAVLYIVKIEDGTLLKRITTGGNGLATPAVVDVDNDYIADYAYAGDLNGNLWKFDLTDADPSNWQVANGGSALFVTEAPAGGESGCVSEVTSGASQVVDNRDYSNVSSTGSWSETSTSNAYNTYYRYHYPGSDATFTFNFDPVSQTGTYSVYGWWRGYYRRHTSLPIEIYVMSGSSTEISSTTATVNQSTDGRQWNYMADVEVDSGQWVKIVVPSRSEFAGDSSEADAFKIQLTGLSGTADGIQPITVRPEVSSHPVEGSSGYMIYFGTGKYLEEDDASQTCVSTQSFYGVLDEGSPVTRDQLLGQSIESEQTNVTFGTQVNDVRTTSSNEIDWSTQKGWVLDFVNPTDSLNHGEKSVHSPILSNGRVIFTTTIASQDVCSTEESGWLYELNWADGGVLESTFDLDEDSEFDDDDKTTVDGVTKTVTAKRSTVGIPTTPSVLEDPNADQQYKYISGSLGGAPEKTRNYSPKVVPDAGRQSWRQIFF